LQRHDAQELKDSLTVDDIRKLLIELGADYVPDEPNSRGELITNTICHGGDNHKLYYYVESSRFHCFTGCACSFDIYELVRRVYELRNIELSFSSLVSWVAEKSGKNAGFGFRTGFVIQESPKENEELQWMNKFSRKKIELPPLKTYSDRILNVFSHHMNHPEFTFDGITPEAMDVFDIKYYNKSDALIIPHRNIDGEIVGLMSRNLDKYSIEKGFKYVPAEIQGVLYNHIKSQNIFGLNMNKKAIQKFKKVVVFEAEKSVLQVESMYGRENNFSVALSGKNISQFQTDLLLSLEIEEIAFCFDKEFDDPNSLEAQRFAQLILDRGRKFAPYIRVFTTWDTEGLLSRNESPSDRGKTVLEQLMATKQEILNKE